MLDPSSSDGSFYMENVMKNSIDRVEILKGTQSSLYGSNAIGGTIHIFTKKGREGNHSNFVIENGSNNTKNFTYSVDGADDKFHYYLGLNKLLTHGISAMNDNNENDQYRNDGIVGNFGYKINDNFKIENSFRYADTFYEYDAVNSSYADINSTDNIEGSYTLKLIHEKDKFKNSLIYNKLYIERATTNHAKAYTNYFGYRDTFNFLGKYNFNLDNKIVYGIDSEFDASRYPVDYGVTNKEHDESIISQYFDFQFRPFEKLYSTFGLRSDDHTTAGRKTSGRTTVAYQLDGNSKIRSSLGAGVRFPALYDYKYGSSTIVDKGGTLEDIQSERGLSFDLGYDTYIDNLDLGLSATLFKTKQKNSILNNARTEWVQMNATGVNTSEGIELNGNWKPVDKKISLNFGYTFTDSYDAATCDPDEKAAYADNECRDIGSKVQTAKVRVPRHAIQSRINYNISPNLKSSLKGKYVGETRDFGNANNDYTDVILTNYFVFDIETSYNLFNTYKTFINIGNILDKGYEQAYQYSSMGRTFNFGIRRVY
jgi:vitamin B12 transporter